MKKAVTGNAGQAGIERLEDRRLFASISGLVFNDINGDGVRQANEAALAGRQVYVDINSDGQRQTNEPLARTDSAGRYQFANLKAGKYLVRQLLPTGNEQTAPAGAGTAAATITRSAEGVFKLEIIPGPKLAANAAALAAARAAAAAWAKIFADPVTVRIDLEFQPMGFGEVLAGTNASKVTLPYDQVRDALVAGLAPDEAFARALPTRAGLKYRMPSDELSPFHFDGQVTANRANLLSLGFAQGELDGPRSLYRSSVVSDGVINVNSNNAFDFNRADGVSPGKDDFYDTVLHEIGHVLGFESALDVVDLSASDPYGQRDVTPMPLDLFRLKPGAGAAGFGSAVRQWVTGKDAPVQVFYDGGWFDPIGVMNVPGLKRGDVPMSTGLFAGDNEQASHWKDDTITKRFIGAMDPTLTRSFASPSSTDIRALGLLGWDVRKALPGRTVTVATAGAAVVNQNFGVRSADDDDQLSEATTLAAGATAAGQSIASSTDVDLFAIHGKKGETFTIDVDGVGAFDSYLRIFSADGAQLAANDNAAAPGESPGLSSYQKFVLPRDGTFFIGVSGKGNGGYSVVTGNNKTGGKTGAYSLTIKNDTFDDDATLATARKLTIGQTVSGAISPSRDVDIYKFTVTAGQRIGFDIDFPAGSTLDSFLRLFDSAGREIEVNDDAPARGEDWTFESYIEHRFSTGGTYYIGVSTTGNDRYDPIAGTNKVDGPGGAYILIAKLA